MNKICLTPEDKQNIKKAVKSESFTQCILHSAYSLDLQNFILKQETKWNLGTLEKEFLENTQAFEQIPLAFLIDFLKITQAPCLKGKDQFKIINAQKELFMTIIYNHIRQLFKTEKQNISLTQLLTKNQVSKIIST